MSKIVIALGGNALGKTATEQKELLKGVAKHIVDLVEKGNEVVISHGNGPQVGMIYNALRHDNIPFAESGAMSQGYIGYHIGQALKNELNSRHIHKDVATIVTQVEVDKNDPAFQNPTKPIGSFYTEDEAHILMQKGEGTFVEDSGRGYRKVVASPKPIDILELDVIKERVESGTIVVACGGGGIPVVKNNEGCYEGVDAVIDKDRTSALLAEKLGADKLLILTAVDSVYFDYNKATERKISKLNIEEAEKAISEGQFPKGSMLPKIEACLDFAKTGGKAIITSLEKALPALEEKEGTVIYE